MTARVPWGSDPIADAHRSAAASAVLGIVGAAISTLALWHKATAPLVAAAVAGFSVNFVVLVILCFRRKRQSAALGTTLFLMTVAPALALIWCTNEGLATNSPRWVPYEPDKMSVFALALIAPPGWWTGIVAISTVIGAALIHHAVLDDTFRRTMVAGEPVGIIAYGLFAYVLLAFRQHGRALQLELARAQSEKAVVESIARFAMSVRDLANSPVQTLELIRHTLPTGDPHIEALAKHMQHALDRLRNLNEILVRYQHAVTWEVSTNAAIDAELQAEKLLEITRSNPASERDDTPG